MRKSKFERFVYVVTQENTFQIQLYANAIAAMATQGVLFLLKRGQTSEIP